MKIFCKDLNRDINKRDCLPDNSSNACKNCPEKNARTSGISHKPKDIAFLYLESPEQLPPILRPSSHPPLGNGTINKRKCEIIEKFISPKILNTLKIYPKNTIFQIYDALAVFSVTIISLNEDYEALAEIKDTHKKAETGIRAIDTLLKLNLFLDFMEVTYLSDIKDRLIKLKGGKPIIYDPVEFLWTAFMPSGRFRDYIESTPIIMPIGSPGDPLFKALQIVIYKLLDTGKNKKHTEKLVADIINCFSKNFVDIDKEICMSRFSPSHSKKLTVKKLTSKDVNNAIHSS